MFSLELEYRPEEKDLLVAELWEQGCAGIVELQEDRLRVFFEEGSDLGRFQPLPRRAEPERDWVGYSREVWRPMAVGQRFFLVPEWLDTPAPEGRFRIEINPGQAFGTGVHETTQLCLEALERHVRPGMTVLDVGAGSGILAHAALLLGAGRVYGCDNDPVAVEVARTVAPVFSGSADAVRSGVADLVVANISPEANIALAADLSRCLRAGGTAVLSGFETHEAAAVERAFAPARRLEAAHKNTWALLALGL